MPWMSPWERDEVRSRARAMYRGGETVASIARASGVTERQVYRWVVGLPRRLGRRATDAEILDLCREGVPLRQIVRRLGVDWKRLTPLVRASGLPVRKPGHQPDRGGWKKVASR